MKIKSYALFAAILLSGCSNDMRISESVKFVDDAKLCQPQPTSILNSQYKNLPPVPKFDPKDFGFSISAMASTHSKINKDTQISLVVDRACVARKSGYFSKLIKIRNKNATKEISPVEDHSVKLPETLTLKLFQSLAEEDPCLVTVTKEQVMHLQSSPNDTRYSELNNMRVIGQDVVWEKIKNAVTSEVVVAVIDTGNDLQSPDMVGRHWVNMAEVNGQSGVDDDGNGYVDDSLGYNFWARVGNPNVNIAGIEHGEHVAGIIAANVNNNEGVSGVAGSFAKIMHLGVICTQPFGCGSGNPNNTSNMTLMNEAIRYAADNGAKVINLSMGSEGTSTATEEALRYAVSKGVFVAAAAGNYNKEVTDENLFHPAGYGKYIDGVVGVAATDAAPGAQRARCAFSNFSTTFIEIAGPGCDTTVGQRDTGINGVLSVGRGDRYYYSPGTSMATPHVAGHVAVIYGYLKHKAGINATPQLLETILKESAVQQDNLRMYVLEGRHIDMVQTLDYIDRVYLGTTPPPPDGGSGGNGCL